ncbi:Hypothetical protein BIBO1_1200 [Brucella inopinata BO1]|nr:Hypothetical protein BIBO1_1200 [Brucella inopinata BO1]
MSSESGKGLQTRRENRQRTEPYVSTLWKHYFSEMVMLVPAAA